MCHSLCYSMKQTVFLCSFKNGETKPQKDSMTCLNPQSWKIAKMGFEPKKSDSGNWTFHPCAGIEG